MPPKRWCKVELLSLLPFVWKQVTFGLFKRKMGGKLEEDIAQCPVVSKSNWFVACYFIDQCIKYICHFWSGFWCSIAISIYRLAKNVKVSMLSKCRYSPPEVQIRGEIISSLYKKNKFQC